MGIDIYAARFLQSEVRRGLRLGHLLTLGHQSLFMDNSQYRAIVKTLGFSYRDTTYADDLFRAWGAITLDIMDASNFEGANVLHNLNEPIGRELVEKYDCVFDGGTLEHVFNFPVALKNCLEMVKVGGQFITITPANAECGHSFYQFSPELFYNALSALNGFSVERLLFVHRKQWYSVKNPAEVKERVELRTSEPTQFFVSAKRVQRKTIFAQWPQQSDYSLAWNNVKSTSPRAEEIGSLKNRLLQASPFFRKLQTRWRIYKRRRKWHPSNKSWFTLTRLD